MKNTRSTRKTIIYVTLSLFAILCISPLATNYIQNEEKKTSLNISEELIRSGTFEMAYTLAACMIINGIATTSIEWTFESSKPHIAITLEVQYCEGSCGNVIVLSDGTKHNDSGVYQVEQEGLYQFLFWNKDNDEERTNITYRIVFDPGMLSPTIPSFPPLLLGLVSLSGVMKFVNRLRPKKISKKLT